MYRGTNLDIMLSGQVIPLVSEPYRIKPFYHGMIDSKSDP